jgi:hypothetical protein
MGVKGLIIGWEDYQWTHLWHEDIVKIEQLDSAEKIIYNKSAKIYFREAKDDEIYSTNRGFVATDCYTKSKLSVVLLCSKIKKKSVDQ